MKKTKVNVDSYLRLDVFDNVGDSIKTKIYKHSVDDDGLLLSKFIVKDLATERILSYLRYVTKHLHLLHTNKHTNITNQELRFYLNNRSKKEEKNKIKVIVDKFDTYAKVHDDTKSVNRNRISFSLLTDLSSGYTTSTYPITYCLKEITFIADYILLQLSEDRDWTPDVNYLCEYITIDVEKFHLHVDAIRDGGNYKKVELKVLQFDTI